VDSAKSLSGSWLPLGCYREGVFLLVRVCFWSRLAVVPLT
jgi:hypothetical protein